ncbi:MAG: CHAT domain-containing protein [Ardenticatenales bacterium]|nr:CHAT domain-containing protein [Ardenticatenales bacterium]
MTTSLSQRHPLTCPDCGLDFDFELWRVIDVEQRPDLLARVRDGSLHVATCPNGHTTLVDAPLLLYRPSADPALLFSPAQQTTTEQDQEQAQSLVAWLRDALGDAWQAAWLGDGLRAVPRPLLGTALDEGVEAAMQQMAAQRQAQMPAEVREILQAAVESGITITSQEELDAFLQSRPELMEKLAEAMASANSGPTVPAEFRDDLQAAQEGEQHYVRRGEAAGLEEAAQAWQRIVESPRFAESDERFQLAVMNNAGGIFLRRYWRGGQIADLDQALGLWEQAVSRTRNANPDSPDLPGFLNNLGNGLRDRYARRGNVAELDGALQAYHEAVDRTRNANPDSPDLPARLNNLGTGLRDRYARSGNVADLDEAIRVYQQAVQRTPADSPDLPARLNNLGNGLRDRYARSGNVADLDKAVARYRQACTRASEVNPSHALTTSQRWGRWSSERSAWEEATEAFGYGIQAIDHLFRIQLTRDDKSSWLKEAQGIHGHAAFAHAKLGQAQQAVTALERGRARMVGEALARDRADLSALEDDHAERVTAYYAAVARIQTLQDPNAPITDRLAAGEAAQRAMDEAIQRIRRVDGYERFLDEPRYDEVRAVVPQGQPLLYLATTPQGSVALLVHTEAETPEILWGDLTEDQLNAYLLRRDAAGNVTGGYLVGQLADSGQLRVALNDEALSTIGASLLAPVSDRLKAISATGVTLIASGRLGLLPLHATPYDGTRTLLDDFDVAYAPSALVLGSLQREATQRRHAQPYVVGVGNPLPDHATALAVQRRLQGQRKALAAWQAALGQRPATDNDAQGSGTAATVARLIALCDGSPHALLHEGRLLRQAILAAAINGQAEIALALWQIAAQLPASLPNAHAELSSVGTLFAADQQWLFYEQDATLDALWAALPHATVAHFACHGQFRADAPLESSLLLSGEGLTVQKLLNDRDGRLAKLRLAVLSACQTAITDIQNVPDEMVGLPAGFLQAGVPAVVGTLWSVADLSTALLMVRFHELRIGDGLSSATALRRAQQWLRDLTLEGLATYLAAHKALLDAQRAGAGRRMAITLYNQGQDFLIEEEEKQHQPNHQPFADPYFWAGFAYYGLLEGSN